MRFRSATHPDRQLSSSQQSLIYADDYYFTALELSQEFYQRMYH